MILITVTVIVLYYVYIEIPVMCLLTLEPIIFLLVDVYNAEVKGGHCYGQHSYNEV